MTMGGRPRSGRLELTSQLMLIVLATATIVAPPMEGSIAILPALPGDFASTWAWAAQADARVIDAGPYPGSIVVRGSIVKLMLPALAHGAILVNVRFAGCGSKQA